MFEPDKHCGSLSSAQPARNSSALVALSPAARHNNANFPKSDVGSGIFGGEVTNQPYYGDNLAVLRGHVKDESVDLIYLDPPFMSAEDAIAARIDEKCERDQKAWASSSELYTSWATYAGQAGEVPGSQKAFSQSLESRGFRRHKTSRAQAFYGLRLRPEVDPAEHWTMRE